MNLRAKFLFSIGLLGLLCLMLPRSARADTVYTYTGNAFTGGTCPSECITGNFTLATPLTTNDTVWYPTILSTMGFNFTDGSNLWTDSNSTVNQFSVETNTTGDIADWDIILTNTSGATLYTAAVPCAVPGYAGPGTCYGFSPNGEVGIADYSILNGSISDNTNDPGIWTSADPILNTPEPSSLLLLGTGLLALVGLGWRRNSQTSGSVLS